jgi:hypothetical protein
MQSALEWWHALASSELGSAYTRPAALSLLTL